jgi:hypothetical protein
MKQNDNKKTDIRVIIAYIFSVVILFFLMMYLTSCSAQYHQRKFIKKGGSIKCDTTYITKIDTIKSKDGKDSLIFIDVPVKCPELTAPEPKWKTKWMDRVERRKYNDSLRHIEKMYKFLIKENIKLKKQNAKIEKEKTKQNRTNQRFGFKNHRQDKKTENKKARNEQMVWYFAIIFVILVFIILIISFLKKLLW